MAPTKLTAFFLAIPILYVANLLFHLGRHYVVARRTGLPIYVNPLSIRAPLWLLGKKYIVAIFRHLPTPLSAWIYRIENWNQNVKFGPYEECGTRAFWLINPWDSELFVADPATAEDVLRRCRVEFVKDPEMYTMLDIFGRNVVTTNGKVWERHRKLTVPPFNERVSETVWDETGRQGAGARKKWLARSETGGVVTSTQDDTTRIAFNVLSAAGFGLAFDFDDVQGQSGITEADRRAGHRMGYRDALFLLLNNFMALIIYQVGRKVGWPVAAMWGQVKAIDVAKKEYAWYMRDMLRDERAKIRSGEETGDRVKEKKENLMGALIRSEQGAAENTLETGKATPVLSDEEICGTLFVYNLAGHDTTAGALHYAMAFLATQPQWQEWLAEEIDAVAREHQSSLKYATVFPALKRCLALMYEVLRMYGPVPATPRWTAGQWQKLTIDGKDFALPPDTTIKLDLAALHHDPHHWGSDATEFRPDRWIPSEDSEAKQTASDANERTYDWQSKSLISPVPGTFLPWTGGPRVCPGKKFSQVEFTRAIYEIFKGGTRVRVAKEAGESQEEAEARASALLKKTRISFVLKMADGESLGLKWFVKAD